MAGSRLDVTVVFAVLVLNIFPLAMANEISRKPNHGHLAQKPIPDHVDQKHEPEHVNTAHASDTVDIAHKHDHVKTSHENTQRNVAHNTNRVTSTHEHGHEARVPSPHTSGQVNETTKLGHVLTTHKRAINTSNVPDIQCPSEYQQIGLECFHFSEQRKDWNTARIKCELKGAILAHVTDLHSFKDYVIENHNQTVFWIGGHIPANEDHFVYVSGERMPDDIPWGPSNLSGNRQMCLSVGYNQYYDDDWCCRPRHYVCSVLPETE